MSNYIGNGAYCYANSASMLLSSIGEKVDPSFLETIGGFSLGAFRTQGDILFLITVPLVLIWPSAKR